MITHRLFVTSGTPDNAPTICIIERTDDDPATDQTHEIGSIHLRGGRIIFDFDPSKVGVLKNIDADDKP